MYPSPLKHMQLEIYISVNFPFICWCGLEYVQLTLTVQHLWVSSAHWQASAAPLFRVMLPFPSVSLKYKIWRSGAPHRSQQDQDALRTRWRCRSNSNRRTGNVFLEVCILTYTWSLSENEFQGFDLHDDSAILLARRVVIASKSHPVLESKKY